MLAQRSNAQQIDALEIDEEPTNKRQTFENSPWVIVYSVFMLA
jgi:hypothetical protein